MLVVQVAKQQENRVRPRPSQLVELPLGGEEALRKQRDVRRRTRGGEIRDLPTELLVDQDGESRRAGALERRRELARVGVRAQIARRRGAAFDLRDRGEARSGESSSEAAYQDSSCENATSASSRSAAAPEPTASRA
jgi:hypothetical protein